MMGIERCRRLAETAFFLTVASFLNGCGAVDSPTIETLRRTTSPDGQLDAIHNQLDTHGGATVGYIHEIYVVPRGQGPQGAPVVELRHLVAPVEFEWSGDSELTILYERGDYYDHLRFWEGEVGAKKHRVEIILKPGQPT